MKTINISDETWKRITNIKTELLHKTYEDTLLYLLFELNKKEDIK